MIRIEEVSKRFELGGRDVPALTGVSLHVPRGQFLTVMGPSGSGKSTLLHLVAGLDVPTSGRVLVDGTDLSAMNDDALTVFRRRHVGFVFQFFNLLPALTVEENVALPLLLEGQGLRQVRNRTAELLETVRISQRGNHRPSELSGGEMQRVAIARAMAMEPTLLLADEPTGNLDSKSGEEILQLLRATAERYAQTVMLVTHDPRAAAFGDRLVTLWDGTLVEQAAEGARATAE